MSSADLNQFYQEFMPDSALKQRFKSGNSQEEIVNNVYGSNGDNGELKDEELEAIAGGVFCWATPWGPCR